MYEGSFSHTNKPKTPEFRNSQTFETVATERLVGLIDTEVVFLVLGMSVILTL